MNHVLTDAAVELREAMLGRVVTPADAGYDDARSVWNGMIDRRPALIALCRSAADVASALTLARRHGLEVTVRGGGHSIPGHSVSDGALMIHLGEMREVWVDPLARRAVVQGGATLAQLDAATQRYGLATTGGTVSHTGVAGLTLGGGIGWLTRLAGLSIDNLLSAQVVTADGRILRPSLTAHPDLFWAIRGGGGNFGVVTSFEFALHEVGPLVQLGMFFWGLDDGPRVLRFAEELHRDLPRELAILLGAVSAPPAPFVPPEHHGRPGYILMLAGFGADAAHEALRSRIRSATPPLFEFATPLPYVELQKLLDAGNHWGTPAYEKGCYVDALTGDVIDAITAIVPRKLSPQSVLLLLRLDGAYCEVSDDETAFGGVRSPGYVLSAIGAAPTPEALASERRWVRDVWQLLKPLAGVAGGYVNAQDEIENDRVRAIYGAKYERLARIKAEYDPENVFRHNANIPPAARGRAAGQPAARQSLAKSP